MKRFISALAILAAAGAAVGAAGYYLYKKTNPTEENYEDLLITEEMGEEFEIVDEAYTETTEE